MFSYLPEDYPLQYMARIVWMGKNVCLEKSSLLES